MNFNKNYPIVILSPYNGYDYYRFFLIFFNIVIPYPAIVDFSNMTKIKDLIDCKKFFDDIFEMSKKTNLYKNGYKLENGCMLYVDADKNNLIHKEINLDSQAEFIKYIAYAKYIKEEYKDMKVVLLTNDNIIKLTASLFDVETKTIEELIQSIQEKDLLQFIKNNNNAEIINSVYDNIRKNFKGDYYSLKLNYSIYYNVYYILHLQIERNGLDKLLELINIEYFYIMVFDILSKNRDIYGLEKLYKILNDYFKQYCELNNLCELNDLIENNMTKIKSLKDKDAEFNNRR